MGVVVWVGVGLSAVGSGVGSDLVHSTEQQFGESTADNRVSSQYSFTEQISPPS